MVGRLTKDIVVEKVGSQQISKAVFSLAVGRGKKDAEGNEITDFIRCVAWKGSADFLQKYAGKGSLISVSGRIETSSFKGKDGNNVTMTEVVANNVNLLSNPNRQNNAPAVQQTQQTANEYEDEYADIDIDDTDLPY